MTRRIAPLLIPLLAMLVAVPAAPSAARTRKPTKTRCPGGTTPVVSAHSRKPVAKRDKRGRLVCRSVPARRPPVPSATPVGQAADVADALRDAAAIDPKAMARLERAVGRRRAAKLLGLALEGWRPTASAALAGPRARAATTTTWSGNDGVRGSASFDVVQAAGAESGFTATASAELSATREGVSKLSSTATEKLPASLTAAKARLDVTFSDLNETCPAGGKQPGRVKATGKVKVTAERSDGPPVELELEAEVDVSYTAKTGEDGKWTGIDDVEAKTTFRASATGESTKTYRGRRVATGMSTDSILGASNVGAAIERDAGTFDPNQGGVFGPQGSWNFERGITLSDLRSIDNVKAMFSTAVATNLLTLAAVEYVRKITRERAEKAECNYEVRLVVDGRGEFATHRGAGHMDVTVPMKPSGASPGAAPDGRRWTGTATAIWQNLSFSSKTECAMISPLSNGTLGVQLELLESGSLKVTWMTDGGAMASASVDCPPSGPGDPDPPPVPGMPGPSLLGAEPGSFELPAAGGSQPITGGVQDGGDGFFNDGTLTVTRVR